MQYCIQNKLCLFCMWNAAKHNFRRLKGDSSHFKVALTWSSNNAATLLLVRLFGKDILSRICVQKRGGSQRRNAIRQSASDK